MITIANTGPALAGSAAVRVSVGASVSLGLLQCRVEGAEG